ncbi:hypothetical protein MMC19_002204 [Ptychographa xylographoides]|nr:hypothetical protein [Ptychographa xylographoides]
MAAEDSLDLNLVQMDYLPETNVDLYTTTYSDTSLFAEDWIWPEDSSTNWSDHLGFDSSSLCNSSEPEASHLALDSVAISNHNNQLDLDYAFIEDQDLAIGTYTSPDGVSQRQQNSFELYHAIPDVHEIAPRQSGPIMLGSAEGSGKDQDDENSERLLTTLDVDSVAPSTYGMTNTIDLNWKTVDFGGYPETSQSHLDSPCFFHASDDMIDSGAPDTRLQAYNRSSHLPAVDQIELARSIADHAITQDNVLLHGSEGNIVPKTLSEETPDRLRLVTSTRRKRRSPEADLPGYSCFPIQTQQPALKKVRRTTTQEQRENARLVKKLGACMRCRWLKKTVC